MPFGALSLLGCGKYAFDFIFLSYKTIEGLFLKYLKLNFPKVLQGRLSFS